MNKISHTLSWVFLPLLMPIYGLLITMYVPSFESSSSQDSLFLLNDDQKLAVLYMFFIFSVVAPGLSFMLLLKRNIITTIDMESQRERSIPMFLSMGYCILLYILFMIEAPNNIMPKYIYALPLSGALVTASFVVINRWIKISLHAGGAGIVTGFLFAYTINQQEYAFWILPAVIIASGLTIMARLYLKKHTQTEVYTGWSLAVLITFSINFFYDKIINLFL